MRDDGWRCKYADITPENVTIYIVDYYYDACNVQFWNVTNLFDFRLGVILFRNVLIWMVAHICSGANE